MRKEVESQAAKFYCAYCGEKNHTFVDPSQCKIQKYIEDCQVCCQPNKLSVSYDDWNKEFLIQSLPAQ